ncbi:unnamed protein product [Somion occarium]|uniref:Fungal-type protein kinase domain-containing protein n=1 Tax=Somion occarium TaxID=3059160 RepID=A0ABP1DHH3_9APHY
MLDRSIEVPYEVFLELVPGTDPTDDEKKQFASFAHIPMDAWLDKENVLYPHLWKVMQSALPNEQIVVRDTGEWCEKNIANQCRTDGVLYRASDLNMSAHDLSEKEKDDSGALKNEPGKSRRPWAARLSWADVLAFVEVKTRSASPFVAKKALKTSRGSSNRGPTTPQPESTVTPGVSSSDSAFISTAQKAKESLGQLAEYSGKIQLHQHRQHLYSVSIYQNSAWLLFWDRTSLVVSEEIDLLTEGWKVLNFFCRLGKMSPEQLGFDPTVSLASQSEMDEVIAFIPTVEVDYVREFLEEAMLDEMKQPRIGRIYKVEVKKDKGIEHFLIGYHRAGGLSATGRATRGYIAYDLREKKAVFLKDTWRLDAQSSHPECEVYKKLKDNDVRFVATALCGGDVGSPPQRTRSQKYMAKNPHCARIHYRIVLEQVGCPLERYRTSQMLCKVLLDALFAHHEAWEFAEVLHRDISDGNILIVFGKDKRGRSTVHGMLCDWDLCKYSDELKSGASDKNRSGTWVFMSALLLSYPKKPHEVADDLESFFHVLTWEILRFHETGLTPQEMADIRRTYEAFHERGGYHTCTRAKLTAVETGKHGFEPNVHQNSIGLQTLWSKLSTLCAEHYRSLDWNELAKFAPPRHLQIVTSPKVDEFLGRTSDRRVRPSPHSQPVSTSPAQTPSSSRLSPVREALEIGSNARSPSSYDSRVIESADAPGEASAVLPSEPRKAELPSGSSDNSMVSKSKPLQNHDKIIEVFKGAIDDADSKPKTSWITDKLDLDQFEGLPRNFNDDSSLAHTSSHMAARFTANAEILKRKSASTSSTTKRRKGAGGSRISSIGEEDDTIEKSRAEKA